MFYECKLAMSGIIINLILLPGWLVRKGLEEQTDKLEFGLIAQTSKIRVEI